MLSFEKYASDTRNELETKLALLESFLTSCGLEGSLAAKIIQRAIYESIETGRPTIDILNDYCDRLRMGFAIRGTGWR